MAGDFVGDGCVEVWAWGGHGECGRYNDGCVWLERVSGGMSWRFLGRGRMINGRA
jgi:hypothetical protein